MPGAPCLLEVIEQDLPRPLLKLTDQLINTVRHLVIILVIGSVALRWWRVEPIGGRVVKAGFRTPGLIGPREEGPFADSVGPQDVQPRHPGIGRAHCWNGLGHEHDGPQ